MCFSHADEVILILMLMHLGPNQLESSMAVLGWPCGRSGACPARRQHPKDTSIHPCYTWINDQLASNKGVPGMGHSDNSFPTPCFPPVSCTSSVGKGSSDPLRSGQLGTKPSELLFSLTQCCSSFCNASPILRPSTCCSSPTLCRKRSLSFHVPEGLTTVSVPWCPDRELHLPMLCKACQYQTVERQRQKSGEITQWSRAPLPLMRRT